jgi:hypothetical protein
MPTLLPPEHVTQEPLSPGKPLAEDNPLDQAALSALRQFFLILDAWDRAELKKGSTDMQSLVDNPPHQAQVDRNNRTRSRRAE